jgi:hypothetical protein
VPCVGSTILRLKLIADSARITGYAEVSSEDRPITFGLPTIRKLAESGTFWCLSTLSIMRCGVLNR